MMSKRFIAFLTVFGLLFAFAFAVVGGEEAKKPEKKVAPDNFTIKPPEGGKKDPVEFPHKKHADPKDKDGLGYACKKCHHTLKSDDETPKKCGECHKLKPADDDKAPKFKDAYHDQCVDCHKKGDGKETEAPKKCNECHKKAE